MGEQVAARLFLKVSHAAVHVGMLAFRNAQRYGERDGMKQRSDATKEHRDLRMTAPIVGAAKLRSNRLKTEKYPARGRSSVGRAPALQAGGQEFESLRLHASDRAEDDEKSSLLEFFGRRRVGHLRRL